QVVERGRTRHADHVFVDPAALGQRLERIADHDVIADDFVAFGQIGERDLVALRHALAQHQAIGENGALAQTAVVDDDRDVVVGVNANVERRLFHCIDPFWPGYACCASIHTSSYNIEPGEAVPYLP